MEKVTPGHLGPRNIDQPPFFPATASRGRFHILHLEDCLQHVLKFCRILLGSCPGASSQAQTITKSGSNSRAHSQVSKGHPNVPPEPAGPPKILMVTRHFLRGLGGRCGHHAEQMQDPPERKEERDGSKAGTRSQILQARHQ